MKTTVKQNIRLVLLFVWGFVSLIICAGEEAPGASISETLFFGTKAVGLLSFLLCYRIGRRLSKKRLLPTIK